jgi:hypothetical protein
MAMMIPRPSKEGFLERKEMAPVSLLGCRAQQGNLSILLSATEMVILSFLKYNARETG